MKREVIPTSPQYPGAKKNGSHRPERQVTGLMILGVLAGAAAGFAASLFVLSQFDIQSQQIVIDTSSASSSISQSISVLAPSMRDKTYSIVGTDGQLVAQGVVVTTDGWIVTPHDLGEGEVLVNSRRQTAEVEQKLQDPFTGLFFLKINQSGLPVVTWANQDEVSLGLWGFVMQLTPVASDQVAGKSIQNLRSNAGQEQSLLQLQELYAVDQMDGVVDGVPYVAQNSRVIGLYLNGGKVIPGPVIEERLTYFIDHQSFKVLPDISTKSLFFSPTEGIGGFLVTHSGIEQIQTNDMITAINGVDLTKQDQLWSVLMQQNGSPIPVTVLRQGQVQEINLAL